MIKGRITAGINGGGVQPVRLTLDCPPATEYMSIMSKDVYVVEASPEGVLALVGQLTVPELDSALVGIRDSLAKREAILVEALREVRSRS